MAYAFPASTGGSVNPLQTLSFVDDFLVSNTASALAGWRVITANGADSNVPAAPLSTNPGVVQLTLNTASNAVITITRGQLSTTLGNIILGGGEIDLYWVVQLPTLSDGTDTYEVSIGFGDGQNSPDTSFDNGVFFNYSSTINSGSWQLSTSSSTTKTTSNTATAVTTSYTTLRININAAATTCTFYVDGVSQGTISTNIPTSTICPAITMAKSAGTNARVCNIDLCYCTQTLSATR